MSIDKKELKNLERLSMLKLNDEQGDKFLCEINDILSELDTLSVINTEKVKPMTNAYQTQNVFREDKAVQLITVDELLSNAPEKEGSAYLVPKVIA